MQAHAAECDGYHPAAAQVLVQEVEGVMGGEGGVVCYMRAEGRVGCGRL